MFEFFRIRAGAPLSVILAMVLVALGMPFVAVDRAHAAVPWPMVQPTSGWTTNVIGFNCESQTPRLGHEGIDVARWLDDDIVAAYSGTLTQHSGGGAGNYVVITHPNGYVTRYLHLQSFVGANNRYVKRGDHR